jgi:hypothetical protein
MKILRIALGVIVGLYGLVLALPLLRNSLFKLGRLHNLSGDRARMVPLWQATAWWQLAIWLIAVALMLAAAFRLFAGRSALAIFAAGFVVDAGLWWMLRGGAAYQQAFTPLQLRSDYYTLSFMLLVGAVIWLVERPRARAKA